MPRPGPTYEISEAWRAKVIARLVEKRLTKAWLSGVLKTSRSTITELLDGRIEDGRRVYQQRSSLVPEVHRVLEWPPPMSFLLDDDEVTLLATYRALSDDERRSMRSEAAQRLLRQVPPNADARIAAVNAELTASIAEARGHDEREAFPLPKQHDRKPAKKAVKH